VLSDVVESKIETSAGVLAYREQGQGLPLLFLQGFLAAGLIDDFLVRVSALARANR